MKYRETEIPYREHVSLHFPHGLANTVSDGNIVSKVLQTTVTAHLIHSSVSRFSFRLQRN